MVKQGAAVVCVLVAVGVLLTLAAAPTNAARILAVYGFPGKSHFMMHNALVRELLLSGHKVTFVTPFSLAGENLGGNYTEVLISVYDFWADIRNAFHVENLFELTKLSTSDFLTMVELLGVKSTEHALQQPGMQALINAPVTAANRYDLLLTEQFYTEAFLALAYKYNVPTVTSATLGYVSHMSQMVGIISPWSYVPHAFYAFTDRMTLWERIQNTYFSLYEDVTRKFVYLPQQDELVRKYFGHLPVVIPSVPEMERNISTLLLNSYMPLTTPRPTSFNMVACGGMHIYPPQQLPPKMKRFLDEAHDGAIYFSLGTNMRSSEMPPEMLRLFLNVFASLKQRVLWKFEDENIPALPANVMVQKWMPQSDILAHPNVKVFITHGGLFGTQESVHYGVPMLGMPFYCDQHLNMNKAVQGGYALSLHFQDITERELSGALRELLENHIYRENMQRVSSVFRDRPADARATAVYWIEYVIRHGGAPHMRAAGLDLPLHQFYLLDVMALFALAAVTPLLLCYFLCCRSSAKPKIKKQ